MKHLKPQGGFEGQKIKLFWKISLRWKRCWSPHQKILFLARVMIFWKLWFACNYSMPNNSLYVPSWENYPHKSPQTWFICSLDGFLEKWRRDLKNLDLCQFYITRARNNIFWCGLQHLFHLNEIFQNNLTYFLTLGPPLLP